MFPSWCTRQLRRGVLHATRVDEEGDQAAQPTPSNRQVTGGAPSFPLTRDGGSWRTRRPPWHALRLSRGGGGERAWPLAHAHASPPRGHCEGHVSSSRRDCPPAALPPRPRLTGACGTWPPGEPRTVPWGEGRPCGQEGPPGTVPSRVWHLLWCPLHEGLEGQMWYPPGLPPAWAWRQGGGTSHTNSLAPGGDRACG